MRVNGGSSDVCVAWSKLSVTLGDCDFTELNRRAEQLRKDLLDANVPYYKAIGIELGDVEAGALAKSLPGLNFTGLELLSRCNNFGMYAVKDSEDEQNVFRLKLHDGLAKIGRMVNTYDSWCIDKGDYMDSDIVPNLLWTTFGSFRSNNTVNPIRVIMAKGTGYKTFNDNNIALRKYGFANAIPIETDYAMSDFLIINTLDVDSKTNSVNIMPRADYYIDSVTLTNILEEYKMEKEWI